MTTEFWNERYAENGFAYGKKPNEHFKTFIDELPKGKILLAAEGEGRNAVYAATKGWDVNAFDTSTIGQTKALNLAKECNVTINYTLNSFESYTTNENSFDCVAFIFTHLPEDVRQKMFRKLLSFLKPNGKVFVLGFSTNQLGKQSGGPKDLSMLFTKEMLENDFNELHTIKIDEIEMNLDEGPYHQGIASIIKLVATK